MNDITKKFAEINTDAAVASINKELDLSRKSLGRIIYSMSHEFSAPLKSIIGLVNLLRDKIASEEENQYLNMILSSVDTLEQTLEKFKIDVDAHIIHTTPVMVSDEILVVKQFHSKTLTKKGIEFNIESNQTKPIHIDVDMLHIVLENVISNAINFSDVSRMPTINIGIDEVGDVLVISVADTGVGIQPQYMDSVFEPFFKATDTHQSKGLGLYFTKNILRKIGGCISIASIYGIGTVCTIELRQ